MVRHPGYLGIILWAIASTLMFGMAAVAIAAAILIVTLVIRTALEDTMLITELDGYDIYAEKVRYRLVPFVW